MPDSTSPMSRPESGAELPGERRGRRGALRLGSEARVLLALLRGQGRHGDQQSRLERFYGPQAAHYDGFRERLLAGREALCADLDLSPGARLIEIGAGTGRNLACLGPGIGQLARVDLVDLCAPLLEQARHRWSAYPNVFCHHADACTWFPREVADAVVFSYSLSMIPDWRRALVNAFAMLRPGGRLAVVDFTLLADQSPWARRFWRAWFGHDGVRPDAQHVRTLATLLPHHHQIVGRSRLPYLPGLSVPYFRFIGRRPGEDHCGGSAP